MDAVLCVGLLDAKEGDSLYGQPKISPAVS